MNYKSYHIVFNDPLDVYFTEPIITEECILEVAETIAMEGLELDKTFDTIEQAVSFLGDQHFTLIPLKSAEMDVFINYIYSMKKRPLLLTKEQTKMIYRKLEHATSFN